MKMTDMAGRAPMIASHPPIMGVHRLRLPRWGGLSGTWGDFIAAGVRKRARVLRREYKSGAPQFSKNKQYINDPDHYQEKISEVVNTQHDRHEHDAPHGPFCLRCRRGYG